MLDFIKELLLIDDLIPEDFQQPFVKLATIYDRYKEATHPFATRALCPGCILRSNMTVAWHSGIYVGDDRVVELQGTGIVEQVSLKIFNQVPRITDPICEVLCNKNGVPCYLSNWAKNANLAQKKSIKYGYFSNNCHRFTISCILGNNDNKLLTYSISDIENVVKGALHLDRVEWRKLYFAEETSFFHEMTRTDCCEI